MSEWKECKLGDIVVFNYGKSLPEQKRISGEIPVFSSAGITGWHNKPLVDTQGIIVGRKGTIGSVYYSDTPFYCIDTAYYIEPNEAKYNLEYIYYLLKTIRLSDLNEDSAVPGLNRNTVYNQDIILQPLPEQKAIAEVLSSLDDKIDLLHRQNKTLEALAETIWRKMFIEDADPGWVENRLDDVCTITRGASPRPIIEYVKDGTVPWIKIADATSSNSCFIDKTNEFIIKDGVSKSVKVYPGDLILSNSATCGLPYFVKLNGCIHDGWLLFRDINYISKTYLYFFLKYLNKELNYVADGSVQNNLNTGLLKEQKFRLPSVNIIQIFDDLGKVFLEKISSNLLQIRNIENMRDALLPRLMSGEVRVKE